LQRVVLTGEQLGLSQRLHVAGAETGDRRRDSADTPNSDDLDLRLASLDAVCPLQWHPQLREAFVRPTAHLVAHLRRETSLRART